MKQRKDGRWEDTIAIPNSKKVKHFYGKTKGEVKRKMTEWQAAQDKGLIMSDALDAWLAEKEKTIQYKTYQGYQAPIKRLKEQFGDFAIKDITPAQIQAFVNLLASQGYKRTTVQRPLDILRMMYDYYITQPMSNVVVNPCSGVRLPSGLTQEMRELADEEKIQVIKDNVSHPFGLFPFFMMYSGLRDGEILAITDKDIKDGYISVTKEVSWQTNQPVIKKPKTLNGIRKVVLLKPLENALPQFKGYLFSADGGVSPLSSTQFRHRWNGYCRDVGLCWFEEIKHTGSNGHIYTRKVQHNTIVPYQLRHEFATTCFEAELDPKSVADLMGHASETMARKVYTHMKDKKRKVDTEKLQNYIENAKNS